LVVLPFLTDRHFFVSRFYPRSNAHLRNKLEVVGCCAAFDVVNCHIGGVQFSDTVALPEHDGATAGKPVVGHALFTPVPAIALFVLYLRDLSFHGDRKLDDHAPALFVSFAVAVSVTVIVV